jgi:hypothetical protein
MRLSVLSPVILIILLNAVWIFNVLYNYEDNGCYNINSDNLQFLF